MTTIVPPATAPARKVDPDSRARTHLANERTFLAWLRTGLSMIAVGVAVAGFLPIGLVPEIPFVRMFSIVLVLSGTAAVGFGTRRYVVAHQAIEAGSFSPAVLPIVLVAVAVAILGLLAIPLVMLLR